MRAGGANRKRHAESKPVFERTGPHIPPPRSQTYKRFGRLAGWRGGAARGARRGARARARGGRGGPAVAPRATTLPRTCSQSPSPGSRQPFIKERLANEAKNQQQKQKQKQKERENKEGSRNSTSKTVLPPFLGFLDGRGGGKGIRLFAGGGGVAQELLGNRGKDYQAWDSQSRVTSCDQ